MKDPWELKQLTIDICGITCMWILYGPCGRRHRRDITISYNVSISWFQKVNSPQNRNLNISISKSKHLVDDFVGELNTFCEINAGVLTDMVPKGRLKSEQNFVGTSL